GSSGLTGSIPDGASLFSRRSRPRRVRNMVNLTVSANGTLQGDYARLANAKRNAGLDYPGSEKLWRSVNALLRVAILRIARRPRTARIGKTEGGWQAVVIRQRLSQLPTVLG